MDPGARLVIEFMIREIPNRTDRPAKHPTLVHQALTGTTPW
ncbi:MAG TPA: hypothetical protein PKC83_02190 [Gemmatimonadaceae bacterium]|nr:hypothetical protein [Gemmatimonadaceae bacterium]